MHMRFGFLRAVNSIAMTTRFLLASSAQLNSRSFNVCQQQICYELSGIDSVVTVFALVFQFRRIGEALEGRQSPEKVLRDIPSYEAWVELAVGAQVYVGVSPLASANALQKSGLSRTWRTQYCSQCSEFQWTTDAVDNELRFYEFAWDNREWAVIVWEVEPRDGQFALLERLEAHPILEHRQCRCHVIRELAC